MRKLVLEAFVVGGLCVVAAACSDEGERPWSAAPAAEGTSTVASSSSSGAGTGGIGGAGGGATVSSSGIAGMGGVGGVGGMAGMGGMGGAGGTGGSGPASPANLTAVIVGKNVALAWTKSIQPKSRVVRKEGSAPTGPDDPGATVVYEGAASDATEPLRMLLPTTVDKPRTYHYAVYGCDGTCGADSAVASLAPTVAQCLQAGGYNIIWRHASATVCGDDISLGTAATTTYFDWWKRCDNNCPMGQTATATTRQLNSTGQMEADAIGKALAMRSIPFGQVLSSEFCRCKSTAQIMQLGPTIEERQALTFFVYDELARCPNTMALLGVEPALGTNTALVGHAGYSTVCAPIDSLAWAEAAIFKPDGAGGATFIARVLWNEWSTLP